MLLTKEVEISPCGVHKKRYKELGYEIPLHWDEANKKWATPKDAKIIVKVEDLPLNSHYKVQCQCDNCGKITLNRYKDYLTHNHNGLTYCNSCKGAVLNSKENNYRWRFDLSEEERLLNQTNHHRNNDLEYNAFIRKVLQRDNYKCIVCGSKNKLNVHHLDGFNWCEEKRKEVSNGVTLCENCHKNFHKLYGTGNNTKKQFEEWYGKTLELLNDNQQIIPTKEIICLNDLTVYNSVKEFCIKNSVESNAMIYKSAKNVGECSYKDLYFMYYDEYKTKTLEELNDIHKKCEEHTNYLKRNMTYSNVILDLNTHVKYRTMKNLAKDMNKGSSFIAYKIDNGQEWNGHYWIREKDYDGDTSDFVKVGDDW